MRRSGWLAMVGLALAVCMAQGAWAGCKLCETPVELPVVFQEDFQGEDPLAKWQPMDRSAWKIADQDGNKVLSMFKDSKLKTKVRSPKNFALIKDLVVGDFEMELKMQSLTKDYGHRDLCLFFGYQSPTRFHYVHMALRADPHAHSIFIVYDKDRVSICRDRTKGLVWGDGWHKVKLVRHVAEGCIKVFFDDMDRPIMTAKDTRLTWGRVGVGSFDDEGNYDDIVLRGTQVEPPKE